MATIQDTIALSDGVSPTLNRITNTAEIVTNQFSQVATTAGAMAGAMDAAAARFAPGLDTASISANAVANSVNAVSVAANRMDAGTSAAIMARQFSAADAAIEDAASQLGKVQTAATQAAGSVNELGAACNQIHAPPEAARSVEHIGSAAQRAVERTKESIGEFSALAMETAQSVMQVGVACDKMEVSPQMRTDLELISAAAAQLVNQINNAGGAASRMGAGTNSAAVIAAGKIAGIDEAAGKAAQGIQRINSAAGNMAPPIKTAERQVKNLNSTLNETKGILGDLKEAITSTFGQFTLANIAAAGIMAVWRTITQAPGKLAGLSDAYSGIMARLNLVAGSQEQAAQLNDQIYASALRARGGYAEMADAVSRIALTAKEAFPNPQTVVPFMENIQKLFTIGGTDITRQKDALLQLTQALGSGKLQGDEFRSIAEAAPMIGEMIAKHMGKSVGELKELSSQGEITAVIMKNAILGATAEINEAFDKIPMKWQDIWQDIETRGYRAFVPVFEQISRLANTPIVQKIANGAVVGAQVAAAAVLGLINNIEWLAGVAQETGVYIGSWLSAGFTILGSVFETLAALAISFFTVYAAGWVTAQIPLLAHIALLGIKAGWDLILTAYAWAQNAAMIAQNAQLLVMYIRLGIVTAATALWVLVTQGLTAALRILNLTMLISPIGFIIALVAAIIIAFGAWAIKTHGLRNTIADVFGAIVDICQTGVNIMIRSINGLLNVINKAAEGLNSIFGTSIGTVSAIGEVDFQGFKEKWGSAIRDGTVMDELKKEYGSLFELPEMPGVPESPAVPKLEDIAGAGKDTADNTKGMKEAMDISDEDIKYMRDIAEQEVINKYTTAEVKIEMTNNNNVSSDVDIDGMVRYTNDSLIGAMVAGAEAVHK